MGTLTDLRRGRRPLDLYEVLADHRHPDHLDLGRLLWSLVTTQRTWVHRRVEAVALQGERRFRRHMSVDCRVPPDVVDLIRDLGLDRFCVPLRMLAKVPLLAFDLRLDDHPVPLLTRRQNTQAACALLTAGTEQIGRVVTPELRAAFVEVATGREPAADRALGLLGLDEPGEAEAATAPPARKGPVTATDLVRWAVMTLDRSFLLLGDVEVERLGARAVFKMADESSPRLHPLPIRAEVGWFPTSFVFDTPDVMAAASYHFEFSAPPGLVVEGGELFASAVARPPEELAPAGIPAAPTSSATVAVGPAGRQGVLGLGGGGPFTASAMHGRVAFGDGEVQGSVLGLVARQDVPEALAYNAEVLVRPAPEGLLHASAMSAGVTSVLLLVTSGIAGNLAPDRIDSSAALLLVLPGVFATVLARPGEHSLVSRLFRGVRAMALLSAAIVFTAAAVLVVGVRGRALGVTLLVLGVASLVPTVALAVGSRRSPGTWRKR